MSSSKVPHSAPNTRQRPSPSKGRAPKIPAPTFMIHPATRDLASQGDLIPAINDHIIEFGHIDRRHSEPRDADIVNAHNRLLRLRMDVELTLLTKFRLIDLQDKVMRVYVLKQMLSAAEAEVRAHMKTPTSDIKLGMRRAREDAVSMFPTITTDVYETQLDDGSLFRSSSAPALNHQNASNEIIVCSDAEYSPSPSVEESEPIEHS